MGPPLHLFLSALASAYPSASGLWLGLCLVLVYVEDFFDFFVVSSSLHHLLTLELPISCRVPQAGPVVWPWRAGT